MPSEPSAGPGAPRSRAGCNDHARRRFVDALKQGDRRVETAFALYNTLHAVERETSARASFDERLRLRQEKSRPVWEALGREIEALDRIGERKTPLAKAIGYWQNQNGPLRVFLDDGAVPIPNAHVERLLRVVALYRNNSLFIGSPEAGPRYAALLTLALNCVLCGANPDEYFCDLFDRLAGSRPAKRIGELMPRVWLAQREAVQQPAPWGLDLAGCRRRAHAAERASCRRPTLRRGSRSRRPRGQLPSRCVCATVPRAEWPVRRLHGRRAERP